MSRHLAFSMTSPSLFSSLTSSDVSVSRIPCDSCRWVAAAVVPEMITDMIPPTIRAGAAAGLLPLKSGEAMSMVLIVRKMRQVASRSVSRIFDEEMIRISSRSSVSRRRATRSFCYFFCGIGCSTSSGVLRGRPRWRTAGITSPRRRWQPPSVSSS